MALFKYISDGENYDHNQSSATETSHQ